MAHLRNGGGGQEHTWTGGADFPSPKTILFLRDRQTAAKPLTDWPDRLRWGILISCLHPYLLFRQGLPGRPSAPMCATSSTAPLWFACLRRRIETVDNPESNPLSPFGRAGCSHALGADVRDVQRKRECTCFHQGAKSEPNPIRGIEL